MKPTIFPIKAPSLKDEKIIDTVVAIDLGSNSFHMVVASVQGDVDVSKNGVETDSDWFFRWIDRRSEKVRLALGLDEEGYISSDVQDRALACLERFAQRIAKIPSTAVRVLGTNTLRVAKNGDEFIARAEAILKHPINVIDGGEEARLIYLGVAHANETEQQRLVVDIGGGSTEVIIGKEFDTKHVTSLPMGCVSFNKRFFPDNRCNKESIARAISAARREVLDIHKSYKSLGWEMAIGASGSIKAIYRVIQAKFGTAIDLEKMNWLCEYAANVESFESLDLEGLSDERKVTFVAGLCVLTGVFMQLGVSQMELSSSALREGALYDLMGRMQNKDIRERTVNHIAERSGIDREHATAIWDSVRKMSSELSLGSRQTKILRWSVMLHEWGLTVSHSKYHVHGAYLLTHTDLSGFSRKDKQEMAFYVDNQRKKIDRLGLAIHSDLLWALVVYRLGIILHRDRKDKNIEVAFSVDDANSATLELNQLWLNERPLTQVDLEQEINVLNGLDVELQIALTPSVIE